MKTDGCHEFNIFVVACRNQLSQKLLLFYQQYAKIEFVVSCQSINFIESLLSLSQAFHKICEEGLIHRLSIWCARKSAYINEDAIWRDVIKGLYKMVKLLVEKMC